MSNLIASLTREYFNSYFNHALIDYNGDVLRVVEAGSSVVVAENLSREGDVVNIPHSHFTGFKVFSYPLLGYRRFGDRIGWMGKKQSVKRGLRTENITVSWSAATRLLVDLGAVPLVRLTESEKALAAFNSKFDTPKDVPDLLAGDRVGLVFNPNLIVEPSTEAEDDWYSVVYKQAVVGKMDNKGVVTWKAPQHSHLLPANLME